MATPTTRTGNIREAFEYAAKNPTSDFANNLKQLAASGALDQDAQRNGIDLSAFKPKAPEPEKTTGQKILNTGTDVANFFGAKSLSESIGADVTKSKLERGKLKGVIEADYSKLSPEAKARLEAQGIPISADAQRKENASQVQSPTQKQVLGSLIQTGANFIPGAGEGLNLAGKIAVGAATGYAFDAGSKLQEGKSVGESLKPGAGTVVGGSSPVAGAILKPATKVIGRLFKGLGSGLSGVSSETIDKIITNPEAAEKLSQRLAKNGNDRVLEDNTKTIINGVSKIKQEARSAFGKGLDELSSTDIDNSIFRKNTQSILDRYGVSLEDGKRLLQNVEFDDPKNLQKASNLIDKLSNVSLDGKSIRKLADDIENSAYKVATSDERLSFNAFVKDLSENLRNAITQSTPKLEEINQAFSTDMQLAEAIENIFGKVNYKNLPELVRASQKMEGLFNQTGLAPEVVDKFLERIGQNSSDFKTSEAVRQISNKSPKSNTTGLTLGEMSQQVTSSVVTPKMVKNIAIKTGLAEKKVLPFLNKLKPAARDLIINTLVNDN